MLKRIITKTKNGTPGYKITLTGEQILVTRKPNKFLPASTLF